MPYPITAFFTRVMGRKRLCGFHRVAHDEAPFVDRL
jgi:hypothetical protein